MHHTIEISLVPERADTLSTRLETTEGVIGLSHARGQSIVPRGDVLTVHVLNQSADEVLRAVKEEAGEQFSVVTSEAASFIDPEHQERIENDADEAVWEEMETGLRHQGRVTPNFLALMTLGGAVAALGLVSNPVPQAIAFIASAMIAPGYEPLAKMPLGLVLGRWGVVRRGLESALWGYAGLILGAALMFGLLMALGETSATHLARNSEVRVLGLPDVNSVAFSVLGGLTGMIMIVAYRRSTIAGPLLLLSIIPAAALIGAAAASGQWGLVKQGVERLLLDVAIIWGTGALVVWIKQKFTHRRKPLL
ncbi:MAG: DUF389 domain-containing protein [Armatimonadetes bacterium]|nr:DUF389 domain-containing protein [Armatimonadota bacterium]